MEKAKVGVFICHCGSDIGGVLDVPELMRYARVLPNVVLVQDNVRTCTPVGLTNLATAIAEHGINRVVVASCTPRTHAPLFRDACERAGLNPYLFEFVNIRDQCALVHMEQSALATEKAKDLLRMGVASAIRLRPLNPIRLPIEPEALVIGAGVAGMTAALSLANRGFRVKLVEKESSMGGLLRNMDRLHPTGGKAREFVAEKVAAVSNHPNIATCTSTRIHDVKGVTGHYEVAATQEGREHAFTVGSIIVATGAQELIPEGLYSYDGEKVITQGQLERLLAQDGWIHEPAPHSIVMIQCVGSRDATRPYCSRICCMTAMKNATAIKEAEPGKQVYVLYRDMLALGSKYESLYTEARDQGVLFIQYDPESPPQVLPDEVVVQGTLLGETLRIGCDLTVLSTPLIGQQDAAEMADLLDVMADEYGFYREPHLKHRPLDMTASGVFQCGAAHWPCDVGESVFQAYGAAARASILLGRGEMDVAPTIAAVNVTKCSACGLCEQICPYNAVAVTVVDQRRGTKAAQVSEVLCQGCGACVAGCRSHAIDLAGFSSERMFATITAFR